MTKNQSPHNKALSALKSAFGPVEEWEINPLIGGLSGASLFLADNGQKTYVVRVFDHLPKDHMERLILAQKAAAAGGYGPQVYFDDLEQEVIIMDYLAPQPINTTTLHQDLALLLKKIHTGPELKNVGHIWERIRSVIQTLKAVTQSLIDLEHVESYLDRLVKEATQNLESAPCHRDLNPTNLIYTDQKFFAVDYDSTGQDDPYIDVAETALFYCLDEDQENAFLTLYLDHSPSSVEIDKFRLMKKIAFLFYGMEFLRQVPSETWGSVPHLEPFRAYIKKLAQGVVSLEEPQEKLKMGMIMLQEAMKP